ncbi:class I adenylate-forming enzyme family protein [Streptomyces sp. NPDC004752]
MAGIVEEIAEHAGDKRPAIVGETRTISYRELIELTRRLAGGLQRTLPPEDNLCIVVSHPGLAESLALTLAGWSLGFRVAAVPPYLKARELSFALAACGPCVTISDRSPDLPQSMAFSTLLHSPRDRWGFAESTASLLTFTSGAAGRSTCVERPVSRLSQDLDQLVRVTGLTADDRVTAMSTALSTTSVLPAIRAGATVVRVPLHSPRQFWQSISEQSLSVISGTPYTYELAARGRPDPHQLKSVRLALTTSARLRPSTIRTVLRDTGVAVRNVMCSGESGTIAYNDTEDPELLARSVGRPLPGVTVEIRGDDGRVLPAGQAGRIRVRSPFAATGYRNDPEEGTAAVFQGDWVVGSDVGHLDEQGYLHLTGRNDHKIHFDAAKLDPQELEGVLMGHPAVTQAYVFGENHERLGQIPVAHVVVGRPARVEDLLAYCREQLSSTKVPQKLEIVATITKDVHGKPVRPQYVRFD